jgi:hypothetical protein
MMSTPFYADIISDTTGGGLTIGPCNFLPSSPGTLNSLGPTACDGFLHGGTWMKGEWWACEYGGNRHMWQIDVDTGTMNFQYDYDPFGELEWDYSGLSYDPITDRLLACNIFGLYLVTSTGQPEPLGDFPPDTLMAGIAFDENGTLYGLELVTDMLYEIDSYTAALTVVGSLNVNANYAQDISFDMDTGILYLAAYTHDGPVIGGALYTCNKATGAATFVGSFENRSELGGFAIPYNSPPTPPVISGPASGKVGIPLNYSFTSTDPEGEQIKYLIDWDDGSTPTLSPFQDSGASFSTIHTWDTQGTYIIKSKAQDASGAESDWGELQVTMPKNKIMVQSPFFYRLFERFPILSRLLNLI